MTLNTYADLFEDDLDAVSDRMNEVRAKASVVDLWGNAENGRKTQINAGNSSQSPSAGEGT
jgi:hypothetical protein